MVSEKIVQEAQQRIKEHLAKGSITKKSDSEYFDFFLKNAEEALLTADTLFELTTKQEKQELLQLQDFNASLWVVNASYYSMFYMVRALLEKYKIKLRADQSIHQLTFDALIHYFYESKKLEKQLIESFIEAKEESHELLGRQKVDELVQDYYFEKKKRGLFTYETGLTVMITKAKTSLQRAKKFRKELRKLF